MRGASVLNEVEPSPRISGEELRGEQVALEAIAPAARGNEVAWRVQSALGEGENVIDCREVEVERGCAVDAAPAAITHHGVLDGPLLVAAWRALGSSGAAGDSG